jgi:hypothetical protein
MSPQRRKRGDIMTHHNPKFPTCARAHRLNDILMVSSFALWAMVIGFAPVFTYRLLVS